MRVELYLEVNVRSLGPSTASPFYCASARLWYPWTLAPELLPHTGDTYQPWVDAADGDDVTVCFGNSSVRRRTQVWLDRDVVQICACIEEVWDSAESVEELDRELRQRGWLQPFDPPKQLDPR